ncbi:aspartate carbamoyltransferase [Candidatus Micrarchaeota archaeon CG08_land_8_20_14_0_20_49_17]|nr:MAG: aspartate carbamoyltransferase [Candidatus Micrarchaeota archaeon CG1_02_49_24]PIU10144.1 MAG: aspartate carbamoyltransferase [Candidatus Micrarchaeota archaeon CG08_land_8_20_14_0_20_49_17]PIZ98303.1 MAG: aspartate carbamoyltransferase [Candidatus Micrarchaeota archaeon CG_4_10_14_0_2_um_filter_49_7]HII53947.1 aspartate carbamoyltransferase [Candidatus Micrarchaeota archaeon]
MDVISIRDFDKKWIESILSSAKRMENKRLDEHSGKIVATLFFEPSTRTNMSFQSAANRLGARAIALYGEMSSQKKGESLVDTISVVSGYADALIIRHPLEGSARLAADISKVPVVNAGDGGNQHPTQTLIDLYTIQKLKGRLSGLKVCLLGDLKYARAMRSLLYGLSMFGAETKLIAPKGLEMNRDIIKESKEKFDAKIEESGKMDFSGCDVLYICRIQKERFADPYEAEKLQKEFRVDEKLLENTKDDLAILHPLPKIDEISNAVSRLKQAKYFEQAHNGIPVRMAVLDAVLSDEHSEG